MITNQERVANNFSSKFGFPTKSFIYLTLTSISGYMGYNLLLFTLPVYIAAMGINNIKLGIISSIFTVSATLIRPWSGHVMDTRGRRSVMLGGLVLFITMCFFYKWAGTLLFLVIVRILHGFGWGLFTTAAGTVATDIIPKPRLGEGMGIFNLAPALAMLVAPVGGIWLMNSFSFEALFYTSAAVAFTALLFTLGINFQYVEATSEKFILFNYERTALRPALVNFLISFKMGTIVSFLVLYSVERGVDNIGFFFTIFSVIILGARPLSGILADRKGYHAIVIPGIILLILTMLVLAVADSVILFTIASVFYGFGLGFLRSTLHALAVHKSPPSRRGLANSTFFLSLDLGMSAGSIAGGVLSQLMGYSLMFTVSAIPGLMAIAIYLWKNN